MSNAIQTNPEAGAYQSLITQEAGAYETIPAPGPSNNGRECNQEETHYENQANVTTELNRC